MNRLFAGLVALVAIAAVSVTAAAGNGTSKPGRLAAAYSFDTTRGMPTEGSVSYIVVRRKPGGTILRAELRGLLETRAVATPLRPGRYRISAYQRLCRANCVGAQSSPPSHGCGRDVRIRSGSTLSARIHVRYTAANAEDQPHCRITFRR